MIDRLKYSRFCGWTILSISIVMATWHYDIMVSIWFMKDPAYMLIETSSDDHSVEECPMYIHRTCNISCCSLQWIPANKEQTTDRHTAHCRNVGITCIFQLYVAGYNWSRTFKLTVMHCIWTRSLLYILQDFALFLMIFLTYSTTSSHGSTHTSAQCNSIQNRLNDWRFIECAPGWLTATDCFLVFNISATMARQEGWLQIQQSNMRLALNMTEMANRMFSHTSIHVTHQIIKKLRTQVQEGTQRAIECPGH